MGATGPALFSDGLACDVRGAYRELLEDGAADNNAAATVLDRFRDSLADSDDEPVVVIALAVTASKLGRLTPELRDRALALLDQGRGAERWTDNQKLLRRRRDVLDRARQQLVGPQPDRKKLRRPSRHITALRAGDVLAFELQPSDFVALRVVRLDENRLGVAPVVQVLDWRGSEAPHATELESKADLAPRPLVDGARNVWWSTRRRATGRRGHDFANLGFITVGSIAQRPGDNDASVGSWGSWDSLASNLRAWADATW